MFEIQDVTTGENKFYRTLKEFADEVGLNVDYVRNANSYGLLIKKRYKIINLSSEYGVAKSLPYNLLNEWDAVCAKFRKYYEKREVVKC